MAHVLITGSNHYQAQQELRSRIAAHKKTHGDSSVHRFAGDEPRLDEVRSSLGTVSLFGGAPLVVLSRYGETKGLDGQLLELLEATDAATSDVIIFEPNLDKRTIYAKTLLKSCEVVRCEPLTESELAAWVQQEFKQLGAEVSPALVRALIERAGEEQYRLKGEIEKLSLVSTKPTIEDVAEHVEPTPQQTIFELLDTVMHRRRGEAVSRYQALRQSGVDDNYILSMLTWQLQGLSIALATKDQPEQAVVKEFKLSPYALRKNQALARSLSLAEVRRMVRRVAEADLALKKTAGHSDRRLIQLLLSF